MVEIDSRKASLIAEIEVSRGEIRGAVRRCEANLNPAVVVRRSVRNNSAVWLSGAALAGLVLSQLVRLRLSRPPVEAPRAQGYDWGGAGGGRGKEANGGGWFVSVGRLAFNLLKPVIAEWATERLAELAKAKLFTGHPQSRNGVRPSPVRKAADGERRQSQSGQ